jgi:fibronectin type 3 domain-containing protein
MTGRYPWHLIALAMTVALAACGGGDDAPATTSSAAAPAGPSLSLNWDPNTESDLKEYRVYGRTGSTAYAPVATVPKGTTSFVASGLTPGVTYFFRITAVDTSGNESPPSNEVSGSL